MSSTPASIKITSRTTDGSKAAAGKSAKKSITKQQVYVLIAVVGFAMLGYRGWKMISTNEVRPDDPPLNAPLSERGAYFTSKKSDNLDWERRRQHMDEMRKEYKSRDMLKAKAELGDNYPTCVAMAWLAGQLSNTDKYDQAKGVAEKNKVLDAIIKEDDDDKKDDKKPADKPAAPRPLRPGEAPKVTKTPLEDEDKADKVLARALMENWPPEQKSRVLNFRNVLKDREEHLKKLKKEKEKEKERAAAEKAAGTAGAVDAGKGTGKPADKNKNK